MHLIAAYATTCGVKIDRPTIVEKYFPLIKKDFITFHPFSKPSKSFDHWQDVIDILFPILESAGISIFQIGAANEPPFRRVIPIMGQTNLNQVAYLVRRGKLHLGADSFPVHFASAFGGKICALYTNNYISNVGPYWSRAEDCRLLEPDRGGNKPSYSLEERPKTINAIKPETIARSVCELLELPFNYPYETIYYGDTYENVMFETVPNQAIQANGIGVNEMVVRMDFHHDEAMLDQQLRISKCAIVTDKPVSVDLLRYFKIQVKEVIFEVKKDSRPEFIKDVQKLGIPFRLFTDLSQEELAPLKLPFMDYGIIQHRKKSFPEIATGVPKDKLFYKSKKFTLSNSKIYTSKAAWLLDRPVLNTDDNLIPVPWEKFDDFTAESESFCLLKKID